MSIIDRVKKTISRNGLIRRGESVLVALSGGSDSVAMLHILKLLSGELEFEIFAAHINHGIREEADDDEKFVVRLCGELGIDCFVKKADVRKYARENSMSEELAGRKIRYDFFDEVMKKNNIDKLATAHNKNDSAESILLHLFRGCGIDGMCGIPVMRDGCVIRPIIDVEKREVEEYCRDNGLEFVVDKTNFKTDYMRNKVRLKIIPEIENEVNSNFVNTLTANSEIFRQTRSFMDKYARSVYEKTVTNGKLSVSQLIKEDIIIIKNVIQLLFKDYTTSSQNLSKAYIDEISELILKGKSSKTINLPGGTSARIEYDRLYFEKTGGERVCYEYELEENVEFEVPETGLKILVRREEEKGKNTKNKIWFYAGGKGKFTVRNRRNADKFEPVGMNGTKKLSDFFTDLKIPVSERAYTDILTCDGEIVWIVGKRADRRFESGERLMSAAVFERRKNDDEKI